MVLIAFLFVNVGAVFVFFKFQRKVLHRIEIFLYWCISSLIVQNYSAIQSMNLKSSVIPDEFSPEFAHFLNRIVLYPVLSLIFINQFALQRARTKLIGILGYVALMTGLEWLSGKMGVFEHVWWRFPWSAAFWLTHYVVLIGVMKIFRHQLYKGGSI